MAGRAAKEDQQKRTAGAPQQLVEAMRQVLDARDMEQVMARILSSTCELLHAEAASIFLVNRPRKRLEMMASTNIPPRIQRKIHFPLGVGVAGWVAQEGESVLLKDVTTDERHYSGVSTLTGFRTRGYICVPLKVRDRIIGTLQVLNQTEGGAFRPRDLAQLEDFAVVAALALNKSRMQEVALEKKRMQGELEVAQAFQQRLLPSSFDPPQGLAVAGYNRPARRMGGDIYDAFPTGDGYCVLVGDVSGKGPGAALWMASFGTLLRYAAEGGGDPIESLAAIDAHLHKVMPMTSFITVFLGVIRGAKLRYVSAGHNTMLLAKKNGAVELLESTGLPVGMMPDMEREIGEVAMPEGSRLVLFSDGVSEAENRAGEMYGDERLHRFVAERVALSPEELIERIARSVASFSAGTEQADDITLLVAGR